MAPRVYELRPGEESEEHLWAHGLYLEDVYAVLDENRYKVFPDGGHQTNRIKIVGPDAAGRIITIIASRPDQSGVSFIITAWPADSEETRLYSRPGGTQYA